MSASTALPTFSDNNPDQLLICPYDPVHRISAKRYPYHLLKCRKNHSASDFVPCPFNARHEMPRVEMPYHLTVCPDKDVIRQDIESAVPTRALSSTRPRTPPPTQGIHEEHEEDWDLEADSAPFIPAMAANVHEEENLDSYAVIQNLQEVQQQLHGSGPPVPVNLADMTPAQRKNYKRAQKRKEKRVEGGDEGAAEITEEERRHALLEQYALMSGRSEGGFVDFVSLLNQWCQKNRVNAPKYMEGPGVAGGFGATCVVRTDMYKSIKNCTTKKAARQDAALVAVVALNIPIGIDDDDTPCRVTGINPRSAVERERMRETQEQRLLLQAGYNGPQPVLQPPSSFAASSQPVATAPPLYREPAAGYQEAESQMGAMSLGQQDQPEDDGWSTVHNKKPAGVKNPVYNYSLKVAGRGRGTGARR